MIKLILCIALIPILTAAAPRPITLAEQAELLKPCSPEKWPNSGYWTIDRSYVSRCQRNSTKEFQLFDGYKSYITNGQLMVAIAKKYSNIFELNTLGRSHRGYPILAAKIEEKAIIGYKPAIFINRVTAIYYF